MYDFPLLALEMCVTCISMNRCLTNSVMVLYKAATNITLTFNSSLPSPPPGFTTLTYLRVHAQKHHGQEWKDSPGGFGGSASGGVLVCHLCGVHCKTPTQLQGHMGTHSNSQAAPSPITSQVAASSSVSLSNMGTAPTVYVTGNTVVDLLVTDCSSIAAPQQHS